MTQEQISNAIQVTMVEVDQRKLVEVLYGFVEGAGCRYLFERFRIKKDLEWSNWLHISTMMVD